MPDVIGFIGVGNIATAVVEGLATAPGPVPSIVLSPRNRIKAMSLAELFPSVTVAGSNQAVLDASDTVFLCVRPQVATEVLQTLRFRTRHLVISLVPLPMAALNPLVSPARLSVRVLVLPTCVQRVQAVPYWPRSTEVQPLLERLGPPLPLSDEHDLAVLWASTAMIASFLALLDTVADWSAGHGVSSETAADYVATMAHTLTHQVLGGGSDRYARLAAEAATPGGLNEQVINTLRQEGVCESVREALDAILTRISPPTPEQ